MSNNGFIEDSFDANKVAGGGNASGYDAYIEQVLAKDGLLEEKAKRDAQAKALGVDAEQFDYNGTLNINTDISTLKELLRVDFQSFVYLFLYEEEGIEHGIPDFHVFGLQQMTAKDIEQLAIAWPRDHAKTTLAKIACIWLFIYSPFRFLLYVSHIHGNAANSARDIADMIRRPLIQQIYGECLFSQSSDAKGEYMFDWSPMGKDKRCIIRSMGVGGSVRGLNINNKRPDILVLDDVESAEEGEDNKMGYTGISTWYYGTLRKALDRRRSKQIMIGNFVSNKSLLGDNLRSRYWVSTKLSAITKDGKPLWPARWSIHQLRLDLLEYIENGKMHVWLCEMLNLPLNEATSILSSKDIRLCEEVRADDENILLRCITVDPAITENMKHADSAVIAVHVYIGDQWRLADIASYKGIGPFDLYNEIIKYASKWKCLTVGIEVEGYQEALRQVCEVEAARAGITRMEFLPLVTKKKAKSTRIIAFANMIKQGLYGVSIKHMGVLEDLMKFDPHSRTNDDDRPDACAYIIQMVERYLGNMSKLAVDDDLAGMTEADRNYVKQGNFHNMSSHLLH